MYQDEAFLNTPRAICFVAIVLLAGLGRPAWSQQAPQLGTLTAEKLKEMGTTVQLDINLVRVYPEILQNRQFMRYFIALNNCSNPNLKRTLDNELDYPRVEAYYRSKAAEIVGALPPSVTLAVYGGARSVHDTTFSADQLRLGDYDPAKGYFPFTFHAAWGTAHAIPAGTSNDDATDKTKSGNTTLNIPFWKKKKKPAPDGAPVDDNTNHVAELEGAFDVHYNRENLLKTCPAANAETGHVFGLLPGQYTINAQRMGFDVLPMSEAEARKYIENHGPTDRVVTLGVTLRIFDTKPDLKIVPNQPTKITAVTFSGTEARVSVFDNKTGANLGTLIDDHSLPLDAPIYAADTPKAPEGPESAVFMDHLAQMPAGAVKFHYTTIKRLPTLQQSIDTVVAIAMEHDFCKWPLGLQAQHNVTDFLKDIQDDSAHSSRIPAAAKAIQRRMDTLGTGYCNNFQEKYTYSLMINQIWPNGKLANPDAF